MNSNQTSLTEPQDVGRIAKSLTAPQKRSLLWLNIDGTTRFADSQGASATLRALKKKNCAEEVTRWCFRMTPLGRGVREYLQENMAAETADTPLSRDATKDDKALTDGEITDMAARSRLMRRLDEQDARRRWPSPPPAEAGAPATPRPRTPQDSTHG